jgi:hypothetical protein
MLMSIINNQNAALLAAQSTTKQNMPACGQEKQDREANKKKCCTSGCSTRNLVN